MLAQHNFPIENGIWLQRNVYVDDSFCRFSELASSGKACLIFLIRARKASDFQMTVAVIRTALNGNNRSEN